MLGKVCCHTPTIPTQEDQAALVSGHGLPSTKRAWRKPEMGHKATQISTASDAE